MTAIMPQDIPQRTDDERSQWLAALTTLGDRSKRAFEVAATKLATRKDVPRIEANLEALAFETSFDVALRFAAFFVLATYYRRSREYTKLDELLDRGRKLYGEEPLHHHLRAMSLAIRQSYEEALRHARFAAKENPTHAGILHAQGETIIALLETSPETYNAASLLGEAEAAVAAAIAAEPWYPKFYATEARLRLLKKDFGGARQMVRQAIDREDASSADYALRIIDYQMMLMKVDSREQRQQVESRLAEIQDDIGHRIEDSAQRSEIVLKEAKEARISIISLMAGLAGIIAAFIAVLQMANLPKFSFVEVIKLCLVLNGTLMIVFGPLWGAFSDRRFRWSLISLSFLGGLVLVTIGISYGSGS